MSAPPPGQQTELADLLSPGAEAWGQAWRLLKTAEAALVAMAVLGALLLAGARLERYLIKRRLQVLDGTAGEGEPELAGGDGGSA